MVELEPFHLQHLDPLDHLEEGSQVLVEHPLRELGMQLLPLHLVLIQLLLDLPASVLVLADGLLYLGQLVLPVLQRGHGGSCSTRHGSRGVGRRAALALVPAVDGLPRLGLLHPPPRQAAVHLDEGALQLRAALEVPNHLDLPVLARLLDAAAVLLRLLRVLLLLPPGQRLPAPGGRLALREPGLQERDLTSEVRDGLFVLAHVGVRLDDVLLSAHPDVLGAIRILQRVQGVLVAHVVRRHVRHHDCPAVATK
mmetsp:Transcript_24104/g.68697  ORF Transcript_24104/g.68697 Transcript_24104/m.68697 type:complete len:253 (-) Transcript_24104:1044-1802(-)